MGRTNEEEGVYLGVSKTVKLSEEILESLRKRKAASGVPLSTQIRRVKKIKKNIFHKTLDNIKI